MSHLGSRDQGLNLGQSIGCAHTHATITGGQKMLGKKYIQNASHDHQEATGGLKNKNKIVQKYKANTLKI